MIEWRKANDVLGTVNRGNPCESGLCTVCLSDCKGKCETWMSCLMGRKLLYPRNYGESTAGSANVTAMGVGYHALRIQGYAYGAHGLAEGLTSDPDDCIFPNVDVSTTFGATVETKCRLPIMTGALGSTFIAAKYWDSFSVGAALAGIPIVIGENVVGVDKESVIEGGRIVKAPELERRIEKFLQYYDGFGAIIVQMNVEDTRNGVAEYVMDKYGEQVVIELKWGQGAKDIGGEIQVTDIEYAKFLKDRGYVVDPDPYDDSVAAAYTARAVKSFARHSRLGCTDIDSVAALEDAFKGEVNRLRAMGYNRISLKTGSYGMEALAMSIRYAADCELDLLTIDGSGGGTGMSPWNMMEHWGVPSLPLHAKAYDYCKLLADRGIKVPPIALAGGFAREDHIIKALALGAPYTRLVCMGRAPMIAGYLGSNIEGVFHPDRREAINGHWHELPPSVKVVGNHPEEIFLAWEAVKKKVGADEMEKIPFGAIAMYGYADKLMCGVQQFLAGARKFKLSELTRAELMAANRETAAETGIPYLSDAESESAMAILKK